MAGRYQHLSEHERDRLAVYRGRGWSLRAIARALHRTPSTISRELKRNGAPVYRGVYFANHAHRRAAARARRAVCHRRVRDPWVRQYVTRQLRRGWSPELIAGRLARLRPRQAISHETIYAWIYHDARALIGYLTRAHRRRKRRGYSRRHAKTHIPARISVAVRPSIANARRRIGDWEADTVMGRHGAAVLQVVVDRRSRYTLLNRLPRRSARAMRRTLTRALGQLPRRLRHTLTFDNGSENAEHQHIAAVLGLRTFFCTPYASQERGTVENTAGLIRRFFPKRTDFATLRPHDVKIVQRWLNHRPRRVLAFQTPAEVFRAGVALRT